MILACAICALDAVAQDIERLSIPFGKNDEFALSLLHKPSDRKVARAVLFVHGATFPSSMAVGYKFEGRSWMDDLSEAGWDVWALDFMGYGGSSRYPEMSLPANANPPLGRATIAAEQVHSAVEFILNRRGLGKLSIVAHSWGTIVAGVYATRYPQTLDRLVLFGPVAQRTGSADAIDQQPAWWCVSEKDQTDRFSGYVPHGEAQVFEVSAMKRWAADYLQTDTQSGTRSARCVRVPNGPGADIEEAWHGHLAYDPHLILAPTLIVRGEWDVVTKNADAEWLFRRLDSAPVKRDVVISKGTHVMHLESSRLQLYSEVKNFLNEK
jgi:pimeloyl-ACP methyl ester carboxylesterase